MDINFNNIDSITQGLLTAMQIPKPPDLPIPSPLVLLSESRAGLSAQEMAAEVIRRQAEAGIPVGALPDGSISPSEQMEIIRMQVLIEHLTTKMRTTVAIVPGTALAIQGVTATGEPVIGTGTVVGIASGSAVIQ